MNRLVLLVLMTCSAMLAQRSHVYVFAAPISIGTGWSEQAGHAGAGFDVVSRIGVGFSAEAGYVFGRAVFLPSFGVVSVGPTFHLPTGSRKFDPFVTAGVGAFVAGGRDFQWNYGGGLNYWFTRRIGFKVELRDHRFPYEGEWSSLWGVRFGLTLH